MIAPRVASALAIGRFTFHADNTGDTALPVPTAEVTPLPAVKPRSPAVARSPGAQKPPAPGSGGGENGGEASRAVQGNIERVSP